MIHPLVVRVGRARVFTMIAPCVLPRLDMACHRLTRGRWLLSRLVLPTVTLTTTGRRSGRKRATPLCAYRHPDGCWLVVGTNFGSRYHPAWSTNLLWNPRCTVTVGGRTEEFVATLLAEQEIARERQNILRILPMFDDYASRACRDIRVFRLDSTDGR